MTIANQELPQVISQVIRLEHGAMSAIRRTPARALTRYKSICAGSALPIKGRLDGTYWATARLSGSSPSYLSAFSSGVPTSSQYSIIVASSCPAHRMNQRIWTVVRLSLSNTSR